MLLTFDFKTVEEAQEFLAWLVKKPAPSITKAAMDIAGVPTPDTDAFRHPTMTPAEAAAAVKSAEPKKRGPKPKAPAPEKVYGIEDCRTALSALFDAKGRDAAKAALAEFKVARIGELKADQYRGFIVTCETLSQPE